MRKAILKLNLGPVLLALSLVCLNAFAAPPKSAPAPAARPAAAPARPAAPAGRSGTAGAGTAGRSGTATTTAAGGRGGATTANPSGGRGGATTANPSGGRGGATTANPSGGRGGATTANPAGGRAGISTANPSGGRGGAVTAGAARPNGGSAISHAAPAGSHTTRAANGAEVRTRANGQRSDVHDARRGMDVHNSLSGNRVARVERADHSRIVAERGGRGYVQRPYAFRGHEYAHRTYYFHGRAYDRFYRPYLFNGVALEIFAPARYYPVGFYSYAYYPWATPVPYAWGFAGNPWYGYYGGYFVPAPMYPNASVWLTDYMVSNSLQESYQARIDAGLPVQPMPAGQAPLSPEVRAAIAEEVNRQIALETAEAQANAQNQEQDPQSSSIARMMTDGQRHTFVVGQDLDVTDIVGKECLMTAGDVLQLQAPPAAGADHANLLVLSNKGGQECGKSTTVAVALSDLQDMQNQMREKINLGLGELQTKQGKGLPPEPPTAAGPATAAPFTQGAPPPEPNIATEIAQQAQEADKAEAEAGQAAQLVSGSAGAPAGSAPKQVSMGMTESEVQAILGAPRQVANAGTKKMYIYSDMKVTMVAGKVTDIQ